eukprot:scaffold25243_cov59-Attheya_sp.AAC.1
MVSTWVPLVQIETASVGGNSGGSRSNNDTKGGGFTFWMNRAKIRWGRIDQASRCEVGGVGEATLLTRGTLHAHLDLAYLVIKNKGRSLS